MTHLRSLQHASSQAGRLYRENASVPCPKSNVLENFWLVQLVQLALLWGSQVLRCFVKGAGAMLHGFEGKGIYWVLACLRVGCVLGKVREHVF